MSHEMKRKAYPSDLSEAQWEKLAPLLPQPGPEDRPLEHSRREIINAIFDVLRYFLRVEAASPRFASVADGLLVSATLAEGRHLGAGEQHPAPTGARADEPRGRAERGDHR